MTPTPLVEMTRFLGQPHLQYVIIGEGNTSQCADTDTFWIKASGQQMATIDQDGFVQVNFEPILALLDAPLDNSQAIKAALETARVDRQSALRPSVEVAFHALLLAECDVQFIAHTHPIAINQIMCSTMADVFATNRIFPDEVVLCGPRSVHMPYVDPGLPLAQAMREPVRRYMDDYGEAPKVILLANHGLITLAQTPTEAVNITAMAVKAATIFSGACAIGEPVFMSQAEILHIYQRPDEIYRRQQFVENR